MSDRQTFLVVVLVGLLVGCGFAQPVAAVGPDDAAGSPSDEPVTLGGADVQFGVEETATEAGSGSEHDEAGSHDDSGGHGGADLVHLAVEGLQILFASAAVVSVVLAGRVYGGEIGRALIVSGVGVTLFALQRLWHNFHELGLLGSPSALGEQGLFILAAGALAAGYLSLYHTMNKRIE